MYRNITSTKKYLVCAVALFYKAIAADQCDNGQEVANSVAQANNHMDDNSHWPINKPGDDYGNPALQDIDHGAPNSAYDEAEYKKASKHLSLDESRNTAHGSGGIHENTPKQMVSNTNESNDTSENVPAKKTSRLRKFLSKIKRKFKKEKN